MKKKELLAVKELAAELPLSAKSLQRGCRNGEIPVQWLGRMARFDLAEVRRAMKRNGRSRMHRINDTAKGQGATGGGSRRRAQQNAPAR